MMRHRVFLVGLGLGALLRVAAIMANRPILWFGGDSDLYVKIAHDPYPPGGNPAGYGIFLRLLRPFHSFTVVAAVQHLLGLAIGVVIYVVLTRHLLPRWAAALAAAPVLLDAYQIQLEHLVLSDALFGFLVAGGIALLLWQPKPTIWVGAAGLLLLSLAAVTRTVAVPLLVLAVGYLAVRRAGFRVVVASVAVAAIPLVGYAAWFNEHHGKFALTGVDGIYLWSRTATFADCDKLSVTAEERGLCPSLAPAEIRASSPAASQWLWNDWSPLRHLPEDASSETTDRLAGSFARRAIAGQPVDYGKAVGRDIARTFKWNRDPHPGEATLSHYEFAVRDEPLPTDHSVGSLSVAQVADRYAPMTATRAVSPYASWLHTYQRFGFVRGPVLALILLVGLAGIVGQWRRFGGEALLPWLSAVTLLVVPPMVADFDHRYVVPAIPLACLAAALAARGLIPSRDRAQAPAEPAAPTP